MIYGHLTVICGPMYGGKTTELLKRVLWAKNGRQRVVLVVKPEMENRYSVNHIVTHDGLSVECSPIRNWDQVSFQAKAAEIVFFDEVQFFIDPHFDGVVEDIITDLLAAGKDVVVNGLDLDAMGKPFVKTATLMAMADDIIKVKSTCSVCGRPATKTHKITDSDMRVELGSVGVYEPRCNEHWR